MMTIYKAIDFSDPSIAQFYAPTHKYLLLLVFAMANKLRGVVFEMMCIYRNPTLEHSLSQGILSENLWCTLRVLLLAPKSM